VAFLTTYSRVPADQREFGEVVVEVGILPIGGCVTDRAVCAVFAVVFVILLMAGVAVHRRAFELPVDMAFVTLRFHMLTFQLENREVVIKFCGGPALGCVTLTAIQAEAPPVRLLGVMTGIAILQCHLEIAEPARIDVALYTGQANVLSGELERKDIMVEVLSKTIDAIVAVEAGRAKGQRVRRHVPQILFTVTGIAGFQIEGRDITLMTVVADERFARSRQLMPV
jgi:hypothetical protein